MSERISYADEHGNFGAKPVLLLDRVFGAALAFFGGIATLTFAPIILGVGWPGLLAFQHPLFLMAAVGTSGLGSTLAHPRHCRWLDCRIPARAGRVLPSLVHCRSAK